MPSLIHTAPLLFPGEGPPIRDGWIEVSGGLVVRLGSGGVLPEGIPVRRHKGAILPGLVNAHCHLELTGLHEKLDKGQPFPEWVGQLRGHTADFGANDYLAAAREGVRQLISGGCVAVLDVGNSGAALTALAESPLHAIACVETLGQDPTLASGRFATSMNLADRHGNTDRFRAGLAPHAAYSCSPALLRLLMDEQRKRGLPITLHAAESREEAELYATGTGPLAAYCRSIYTQADWPRNTTTIRWLESHALLPDGILIVHGNMLDDQDMEILAKRKATVVHCPSSHAFFGHPRFPYEKLKRHGVPVALGTDSLASGDSLSMLEQMRLFRENYPAVPLEEIVAMATVNGARALTLTETGLLKIGFRGDIAIAGFDDVRVAS